VNVHGTHQAGATVIKDVFFAVDIIDTFALHNVFDAGGFVPMIVRNIGRADIPRFNVKL
jgi:hypothetical protein